MPNITLGGGRISHPFRTRLVLEEVESRLTLSGAPTDPSPSFGPALTSTSNEMLALPYVSVDFAAMGDNTGMVNQVNQIAITIWLDNGTVTTTFVNFTQGTTTPAGLATLAGAALEAQGFTVNYNGSVLIIWGQGDSQVENVRVTLTHSNTLGSDARFNLPIVSGQNGATGSAGVSLSQSQ